MWLMTTLAAALISTFLWLVLKKKYRLELLSLMFWGAVIMIVVDRLFRDQGSPFLPIKTDGLVKSGVLLGLIMLVPVLVIWLVVFLASVGKKSK